MLNVFTVDLEDWFFAANYRIFPDERLKSEARQYFLENTRLLLKLLKTSDIKATFFVLGFVAETEPDLISEISAEGHEIACHGYNHTPVTLMRREEFRKDVRLSQTAILNACGQKPTGYRAPQFSITQNTLWALNILADEGFTYDSSVYPFKGHPDYGFSEFGLKPFVHESGIIEIPMSCAEVLSIRVPCSGGAYFRFYPFPVFRYFLKKCNAHGLPGIFYIHPWEIGEKHISPDKGLLKFRKYHNSNKILNRIGRLLYDFKFSPMNDLITYYTKK